MSEWIDRARLLAEGSVAVAGGEEVLEGHAPPILEGDGMRGLLAPMVAAVAWAGAVFREMVTGPVDPLALFMRLFAIGLTVRALFLLGGLVSRLRLALSARRARLVLTRDGLYARLPHGETAMPRPEILAATERGSWQGRSGRRFAPVYVVGSSEAPLFVELPPIFEDTPGILAERIMRWLGPREGDEAPVFPEPKGLASKTYDDAANGIKEPGVLVVKHGDRWLRRGPYASVLLAAAVIDGWLRAPTELHDALGPWPVIGAAALAVIVPIGWVLFSRREIAPRRGVAMVITPAELLLRTRAGVLRTRWQRLLRTTIDEKNAWSVLEGFHRARALVLKRREDEPIRYDEAFLGVPAEVAQVLIDAYRRGVLPIER